MPLNVRGIMRRLEMAVPVTTGPQGWQDFAFHSVIGLPELATGDADGYVRIAVALVDDLPLHCTDQTKGKHK